MDDEDEMDTDGTEALPTYQCPLPRNCDWNGHTAAEMLAHLMESNNHTVVQSISSRRSFLLKGFDRVGGRARNIRPTCAYKSWSILMNCYGTDFLVLLERRLVNTGRSMTYLPRFARAVFYGVMLHIADPDQSDSFPYSLEIRSCSFPDKFLRFNSLCPSALEYSAFENAIGRGDCLMLDDFTANSFACPCPPELPVPEGGRPCEHRTRRPRDIREIEEGPMLSFAIEMAVERPRPFFY